MLDHVGQSHRALVHGAGSRQRMWQPVLDRRVAGRDRAALDLLVAGVPPAGSAAP